MKNKVNKKLKKAKKFYNKQLKNDKHKYYPKFSRKLKAYSFESKQLKGEGKFSTNILQITEWDNGEGFDFSVYMDSEEKTYSMHYDEIYLFITALNKMKVFNIENDDDND